MDEKLEIENIVSLNFINKIDNVKINKEDLIVGKHIKNEPDIIYMQRGIELGAIISSRNTEIDKFEELFFEKINQFVKGKIHNNFWIKLVLQDEREIIRYRPKKEFENYKYLPKYLDGIFVYLYGNPVKRQVSLNQKSLMRIDIFPNPNNKKQFHGFANELIDFINHISPTEFEKNAFDTSDFRGSSLCIHYMVCDGEQIDNPPNLLDKFFSKKIIEKFKKDKYKGGFKEKILLLHNYNPINKKIFSSDIHFYTHYRDYILNKIYDLIIENNSFEIYDKIFFADYSVYASKDDFKLTDFSTYVKKSLKKSIDNVSHIGVSFI